MAFAKFTNQSLTYARKKYFVAGAESIKIGSYGRKRTPALKANYLDKWLDLDVPKIKVTEAVTVDIDFTRSSAAGLKGHLKKSGIKGDVAATFEKLKSGKLKLMKLGVAKGDMVKLVNKDKEAIGKLLDYRSKDRICLEIFVVLSATMAQRIEAAGSLNISATKGGMEVAGGVSGSGSSSSTVKISKGTTLAYGMIRPIWDARGRKAKKIKDGRPDQYGAG
jgi:hypothetical protein